MGLADAAPVSETWLTPVEEADTLELPVAHIEVLPEPETCRLEEATTEALSTVLGLSVTVLQRVAEEEREPPRVLAEAEPEMLLLPELQPVGEPEEDHMGVNVPEAVLLGCATEAEGLPDWPPEALHSGLGDKLKDTEFVKELLEELQPDLLSGRVAITLSAAGADTEGAAEPEEEPVALWEKEPVGEPVPLGLPEEEKLPLLEAQ